MIKVGIVGMGRSGWELHAESLHAFPRYSVAAVCDRSEARLEAAKEAFDARGYTDAADLFADDELDLVVISAPSNLHVDLAIAAMEAGKDLVVEKPMSVTLEEADQMLAAAERLGRRMTVFHNRRWDRDYQMLKQLVDGGMLGDLLTIDSRVMTFGPEWANYGVAEFNPQWRLQKAYGGGFLADWGPHLVEQILDLTGEWPESLYCQMRSDLWASEVEDYFNIDMAFASGLTVKIEGSNNARLPLPRWFVVGEQGTLMANGAWGQWTDMRIRGVLEGVPMDFVPQDVGPSSGSASMDVGEGLSAVFYDDLADAMAEGRDSAITAQRARDVMAILEAARDSAREGEVVDMETYR